MRIFLLEPGLRDFKGHYFNHTYLLATEILARGYDCVIATNRRIDTRTAAALPVKPLPLFHVGSYFEMSEDPLSRPIESYFGINEIMLADLQMMGQAVTDRDLLLFPTASERVLEAFARWYGQQPLERSPVLVLSFSFDPAGIDDACETKLMRALYRAGFNALAKPLRNPENARRVFYVTNSAREEYAFLARRTVLPVPIAQPSRRIVERFRATPEPDAPIRVLSLAMSTARKGLESLPEVIARVLEDRRDIVFDVQMYGYEAGDDVSADLAEAKRRLLGIAASDDRLRLIHGPLAFEDYYRALAGTDVLLLTYRPDYDQISGMAHEALAFERTIVAPAGSAQQRMLEEFDASRAFFAALEPEPVASAIQDAAARTRGERDKAAAAADRWFERQGTERYLDIVLNLGLGLRRQ